MKKSILVTGSEGLIGKALSEALLNRGEVVEELDLRSPEPAKHGDTRDADRVRHSVLQCRGIIHLGAISRVAWAQQEPLLCHSINVGGTENVIHQACSVPSKPWVIFASSREVYGQPKQLPVSEDVPLAPLNVYGRAKLEGERLALEAREIGLRTAVVRLSNVYGSVGDYTDRVVPAFISAALKNRDLKVEGLGHAFDFTYLGDVVRGLMAIMDLLDNDNTPLPPLHLLTGIPTTLKDLAELVIRQSDSCSMIVEAKPRSYDVSCFYGDPSSARSILGWEALVSLEEGIGRLIEATVAVDSNTIRGHRQTVTHDRRHSLIEIARRSNFVKTSVLR